MGLYNTQLNFRLCWFSRASNHLNLFLYNPHTLRYNPTIINKQKLASKVCSFIQKGAFRTSQCSILLCLYWVSHFSQSWAAPTGQVRSILSVSKCLQPKLSPRLSYYHNKLFCKILTTLLTVKTNQIPLHIMDLLAKDTQLNKCIHYLFQAELLKRKINWNNGIVEESIRHLFQDVCLYYRLLSPVAALGIFKLYGNITEQELQQREQEIIVEYKICDVESIMKDIEKQVELTDSQILTLSSTKYDIENNIIIIQDFALYSLKFMDQLANTCHCQQNNGSMF
ncbi:Hypothetical_protein [Hexamita inflata]|uniref:Hypothetical_protein n=1 Tax=Hexamita inflata TaxID=28002 RepID=A0AA86PMI5_9EUKA|nr:Hypothetical protein HINF_LOCUS28602 [Hexamita inflata]